MSSSYLEILKYDSSFDHSFAGKYLKNIRLMVMLVLSVILIGVYSFLAIPRRLNPEVKIPIIIVSTVFPGAAPGDVESLVTIPLENKIKSIKGITDYSSSSRENFSSIVVEFESQIDPEEAKTRVKSAVDEVNGLPDDATTPQVQDLDFENIPILVFTVFQKGNENVASLSRFAKKIEKELENISLIDRVEISGADNREIQVIISREKIKEFGIDPLSLSSLVKGALKSYPAGSVSTGSSDFSLTIEKSAVDLGALRELPVSFGGKSYRLKEIADVFETSVLSQTQSFGAYPGEKQKRAVTFSVYKTRGTRADEAGLKIREELANFKKQNNGEFEVRTVEDYSQMIDDQFSDLSENFMQTLGLVFLSMFLLYGARQAGIDALAIPLSLLVVFGAMYFFKLDLSFVSIFSILIALGLFVDNAVVVIEAYTTYHKTGKFSPLQTAILVWRDFWLELFSINLLTVWSFLPLLLSSGIIGEFIYPIPIIVSVAMMGSVAIAIFFTLPSMMILNSDGFPRRLKVLLGLSAGILLFVLVVLLTIKTFLFLPSIVISLLLFFIIVKFRRQIFVDLKDRKIIKFLLQATNTGFISLEPLSRRYKKALVKILARPDLRIKTLGLIIAFTLISYLLLPLGVVKNEFFPKSDFDRVYLQLELPSGAAQEKTNIAAKKLLQQLTDLKEGEFISVRTGSGYSGGFSSSSGSNKAIATVSLKDASQRRSSIEIASELREKFKNYPEGVVQVIEDSNGPPAGNDLQLNIRGDDSEVLDTLAQKTENFLKELGKVTNINRSIKPSVSQLVFVPEREKMQKHQVTEGQIGLWLRIFATGATLDKVTFENEDFDVVLKTSQLQAAPEEISALEIPVSKGYVPLSELGHLVLKPNPSLITRENGKRTISVSAAALSGFNPVALNQELEKFARGKLDLPENYSWSIGGMNEENQKSVESIIAAMGVSALLILVTMVIQLGSFRKAFIVILVVPLAISGVLLLFGLTGTPLSFPALIGLLALFGLVIATSLMIVDKINQNLEAGMKTKEAIIDASVSRFEPILLTSVSQVIGLIPITLSDPMWQGMGGAIIAGMTFSGVLMLFFIPIVYFYLFPEKEESRGQV